MTRYHMKKDGTPGICNALPGSCPLGNNENHVEAETLEQAQRQFDEKNEERAEQSKKLSKTIIDLKNKYIDEEAMNFKPSSHDEERIIENINQHYEDRKISLVESREKLKNELSKKSLFNIFKDNFRKESELEAIERDILLNKSDKYKEDTIEKVRKELNYEDSSTFYIKEYGGTDLADKIDKRRIAIENYNLLKNLNPGSVDFSQMTEYSAKEAGVYEGLPNMDGGYTVAIRSNEDHSIFHRAEDGDLKLVKSIIINGEGHGGGDGDYVRIGYLDGSAELIEDDTSIDHLDLLITTNKK